ncbi:MAG: sulfotransferase [Paracoccaceae bacterium]
MAIDRPRILCLGPNKTGSKSLHRFFLANGIVSLSMGGPYPARNLARRMMRNVAEARPVLRGMEDVEAISDINWLQGRTILNEALFLDRLVAEHPDAYFVYNDRPIEEWLASRAAHHGGRYLRNYMHCYNVGRTTALASWRHYHTAYRARVIGAVDAVGGKLLVFTVGRDDPARLVEFLAPSYALDASLYGHHRDSSEDTMAKRLRRLRSRFFWT